MAAPLCVAASLAALTAVYLWTLRRRARSFQHAAVYELKGQYYQLIGHAWDHETHDFKVVYRPLYHCKASVRRFEAHLLATSTYERWESKFRRVDQAELPVSARALLLPGPFVLDPYWTYSTHPVELPRIVHTTRSGLLSRRSHEPPRLEDIIGDYRSFIDACHKELELRGMVRAMEMDHICYRCESVDEYRGVLQALVPALGVNLVEGMIGGRPISTVRLHHPIEHAGYLVSCIEVPCPKSGSHYHSGLEHAELVVGLPGDSVEDNKRLLEFMEACRRDPSINLTFKTAALNKPANADVSHEFLLPDGRTGTIKFHVRPLYEVIEWEKSSGNVVAVPEGFFQP
ncbi:hypothetical protein AB1Y20_006139 [Prymnesium parvum]|uniref:Uncharacterized protein n=1 Tax=Prymnesium parvum TaxID=97485 RepID=A0AB34J3B7_PRYPA